MKLVHLREAARMFARRNKVTAKGIHRYLGDDEQICWQIIERCYDKKKKYFMTSAGHFNEFYCRDFGWCAESLMKLGYEQEVKNTLEYALAVFKKHGRIEQTISPKGQAFTFPNKYSPDALAFFLHALAVSGSTALAQRYRSLLENEVSRYIVKALDEEGLIRKDRSFSSIKDYAKRKSSCYDNCMSWLVSESLDKLELQNPLRKYDFRKLIKNNFWTGKYFLEDRSGRKTITGDANTIPFWLGIFDDKKMLESAAFAIKKEGLDHPFPLKYTRDIDKRQQMIALEIFAGSYERNTIWAHLGLMYIAMVKQDKKLAARYLDAYRKKIVEHANFLEVYQADGKPFETFFYYSDDSMLWCSNYLALKKSF